jgi:hypothetical protein
MQPDEIACPIHPGWFVPWLAACVEVESARTHWIAVSFGRRRGYVGAWIGIALGQKIESVERWGIVPVRRSLGKLWTNYTLRKRRILR